MGEAGDPGLRDEGGRGGPITGPADAHSIPDEEEVDKTCSRTLLKANTAGRRTAREEGRGLTPLGPLGGVPAAST